ncbi:COMM domain-containing protein 9 [Terrapene carolina triunguis]|uniref:Cytosolic phospholipase A2 beta n=2 Tax=Testudinoidea TaxID=8486 RepID=A0A4D9F077_9SAUR|nr:COMM domain-containing protein 9 [Terrapene carolina triunguis]TFK14995.1 Cytosolic phospholipase A2 beta [Platysternon megacephalum]
MIESHERVKMAAVTEEQFAALQILLKASSKDVVRQLCQECFSSSTRGSSKLIDSTRSNLSVTSEEAAQLICSLHNLTRHIVYRGLSSAEEILSLFPENFHQSLKNLLTKIILENVSVWRSEAQSSQISLPRLVDMDWRVDIKTSSDSIGRMAVPTCLLQLKIQEDAALCGDNPVISAVTVELNKETLDTMLDGLGRIRDQLSAVANK